VTERVVYCLQSIDVDERQDERLLCPSRPHHLSLQFDQACASAISTGELVDRRGLSIEGGAVSVERRRFPIF
jgi:hypothetical protein